MFSFRFHLKENDNSKTKTMADVAKKKKDDELWFLIGAIVLIGGVLIYCDLWYSDWPGMTDTWWYTGLIGAIVLHLLSAAAAYICLREWRDYEFDVIRKWFCAFALMSILYIGGFRAAKNERQGVLDDSSNAKQEQAKQ